MKQRVTLFLSLLLALGACGFLQKPVDPTDPGQAAFYAGVRSVSFGACLYGANEDPAAAQVAAVVIDQTVLPLINGGTASTTAIRDALIGALKFDPRIVAQISSEIDELLKLVPPDNRDHVYVAAMRNAAQSCRNGLAPPSAAERLWYWLSGASPEAVG